jgi:cytochrome c553
MKRIALMLAAGCVLALPLSAHARGNAENGRSKAQACVACHGPEGNKPIGPDFPVLAGQHADYLRKALLDYKSGARANPVMKGLAAPLSKQDIDDLAAYFAGQTSKLETHR